MDNFASSRPQPSSFPEVDDRSGGRERRYLRGTRVRLRDVPKEAVVAYSGWVSSMSARWRPAAWGVVLAVGLLLLGLAQIHAPDPHRVIAHPTFSAIVWTVTAMSLAWRRRFPWVTFTVVIAGLRRRTESSQCVSGVSRVGCN